MLSAYDLLTMSLLEDGVVVIVPDVSAIVLMSVFAPEAAAPRFVLAVLGAVAAVPPLAMGNTPVTCVVKSTPVKAPPSVKSPDEVTVPEREIPLTVPVPPTLVTVPNKQMVDTMLDNFSLRTERQSQTTLELHQQTLISDAEILIDYIKSLFEGYNNIVVNHEVVLKDITKNGMVVSIEFFTTPMEVKDYNEIRQQILINVKKKMESMHIQLAGAALS
jgi:hypothetical protein